MMIDEKHTNEAEPELTRLREELQLRSKQVATLKAALDSTDRAKQTQQERAEAAESELAQLKGNKKPC